MLTMECYNADQQLGSEGSMIYRKPSKHGDKVIVRFEIPGAIWAERINLVGDFNGWDRDNLPFRLGREENWYVEIELDKGLEYRFRYLINGDYWGHEWRADGHARGADGTCDSILIA